MSCYFSICFDKNQHASGNEWKIKCFKFCNHSEYLPVSLSCSSEQSLSKCTWSRTNNFKRKVNIKVNTIFSPPKWQPDLPVAAGRVTQCGQTGKVQWLRFVRVPSFFKTIRKSIMGQTCTTFSSVSCFLIHWVCWMMCQDISANSR